MMRAALGAGVLLMGLAAGCTVGPDYHEPETIVPPAWATSVSGVASAPPGKSEPWWESFGDPLLNRLVAEAIAANFDLKKAEATVFETRAVRAKVAGGLYPELDAAASAVRSRQIVVGPPGRAFVPTAPFLGDFFAAGFDASWEIDLFGRIRRSVEAADADIEASAEAANDVRLTLIGDVARFYVDVRGLQRRIAVTRQTIDAQRDTVELTRAKYRGGTGTGLDVVRAEAQLDSTLAALPPLESSLKQDIHRLGILTGKPPGELLAALAEESPVPSASVAALKLGVPADLLRRRPDIRRAERVLAQATANVGAAVADLYPSLTIAGSIGLNNAHLDHLTTISSSEVWSLGSSVVLPIFDGGRRRAEVDVERARVEEAQAQYQSTVLRALEDVENALTALVQEQNRHEALLRSVERNEVSVALSLERYRKGLGTFLDVLDAQRSLFQAQSDLAISDANVSTNLVALYKALGGGWDVACCVAQK